MSYTWSDMCIAVKETKEKGKPSELIINILNDIVKRLPEYYNMSEYEYLTKYFNFNENQLKILNNEQKNGNLDIADRGINAWVYLIEKLK